jgi:CAAX protease family protein
VAVVEEIGWRGFLVPELARLVSGRLVIVLGRLAWAAFHYPLLLFVPGGNHGLPLWYGVFMFTLVIVAASVPYVWLRLRSRSLWPAVVLHTIHNVLTHAAH